MSTSFPFSPAGCCCGCIYFHDAFATRSSLGANYTDVLPTWTVAGGLLSTTSSGASAKLVSTRPSSATGYIVGFSVQGSEDGDTATVSVENGAYTLTVVFGSGSTGFISWYAGSDLIFEGHTDGSSVFAPGYLAPGSPVGFTICVSEDCAGIVTLSGSGFVSTAWGFPPTQSDTHVILGAPTVNGQVSFGPITLTKIDADAGCGGCSTGCLLVGHSADVVLSDGTGSQDFAKTAGGQPNPNDQPCEGVWTEYDCLAGTFFAYPCYSQTCNCADINDVTINGCNDPVGSCTLQGTADVAGNNSLSCWVLAFDLVYTARVSLSWDCEAETTTVTVVYTGGGTCGGTGLEMWGGNFTSDPQPGLLSPTEISGVVCKCTSGGGICGLYCDANSLIATVTFTA